MDIRESIRNSIRQNIPLVESKAIVAKREEPVSSVKKEIAKPTVRRTGKLIIIPLVLALLSIGVVGAMYYQYFYQTEWFCFTKRCVEWNSYVEDEAWIEQHCKFVYDKVLCNFQIGNDTYTDYPIDNLCNKVECVSSILIRNTLKGGQEG